MRASLIPSIVGVIMFFASQVLWLSFAGANVVAWLNTWNNVFLAVATVSMILQAIFMMYVAQMLRPDTSGAATFGPPRIR